jgi:hypothetical protein
VPELVKKRRMFQDRRLLEAIIKGLEGEGRQGAADAVRELVGEGIHPMGLCGIRLGSAAAQALGERLLGAGLVLRAGERCALGPTRACQPIQVHVTTACLVTLELWMPFATMPSGCWNVRGPGVTQVALLPDEPAGAGGLVGPGDFGVVVAFGRDGEFPAWITFGP